MDHKNSSDNAQEALKELRTLVTRVTNENFYINDSCLLRILLAREYNVEEAYNM